MACGPPTSQREHKDLRIVTMPVRSDMGRPQRCSAHRSRSRAARPLSLWPWARPHSRRPSLPRPSAGAAKRVAVTFTVNSIADRPDAKVNGVCQTSVSGECTLRAAIQEANAAAGPVTIAFAIPGTGVHTIKPTSAYPILTNANGGVTIDGFTQSGSAPNTSPLADNAVYAIEIAGPGPSTFDGFVLQSPASMVRGLDMHGFRHTIYMNEPTSASNVIVGDMLGLLPNGNYDPNDKLVNGSSCIIMQGGAHDNVIGRPALSDRNVISGCSHQGIATYEWPTTRNTIQNNIIGLDPTGTQRRMNQSHGIDINTGTTYTMVGGTGALQRNLIGGNFETGVEISHIPATSNNSVIGNYIGTNLDASAAPAYARNGQFGVNLEGRGTCNNQVCPSDAHNNVVESNVIVNSGVGGVMIDKGQHNDTVMGNLIGELPNGTPAGNVLFGVRFEAGAYSNTVASNVIAYNGAGVQLEATGTQPPDSTESPTELQPDHPQLDLRQHRGAGDRLQALRRAEHHGRPEPQRRGACAHAQQADAHVGHGHHVRELHDRAVHLVEGQRPVRAGPDLSHERHRQRQGHARAHGAGGRCGPRRHRRRDHPETVDE